VRFDKEARDRLTRYFGQEPHFSRKERARNGAPGGSDGNKSRFLTGLGARFGMTRSGLGARFGMAKLPLETPAQ
jgi:hypothetical protein